MAPRGRPPKNKPKTNPTDDIILFPVMDSSLHIEKKKKIRKASTKKIMFVDEDNNEMDPPRQKRKYTRRKSKNTLDSSDNLTNILPAENKVSSIGQTSEYSITDDKRQKQRGRKRGRKSKSQEILFRPEEVIDYISRNYPNIGIENIRDSLINGLKIMKDAKNNPYLLYKFTYKDVVYYYDDTGAILNVDGILIGYFIKQDTGHNKMYLFSQKNKDTRSVEEVIKDIESGYNNDTFLCELDKNSNNVDPVKTTQSQISTLVPDEKNIDDEHSDHSTNTDIEHEDIDEESENINTDIETDIETDNETDIETDNDQTEYINKKPSKINSISKSKPKPKPKSKPKSEPKLKPKLTTKTKTKTTSKIKSKPKSITNTKSKSNLKQVKRSKSVK